MRENKLLEIWYCENLPIKINLIEQTINIIVKILSWILMYG